MNWKWKKPKEINANHSQSYSNECNLGNQIFSFFSLPGSMITVNRIFSRNFPVYGRLRWNTARKRAVFRRNTAPYTTPYLRRIRSYACRILITNGRKTPAWITVKIRSVNGPYLTVYGRIRAVFFDQNWV